MSIPTSDLFIEDESAVNKRGFRLRCYNKDWVYQGFLGGYDSVSVTVRHNATGTADITCRADHPRVPDLLAPGARIVITYDASFLFSGRMVSRGASLSDGVPTVVFHMASDFQYLDYILGWVEPDLDISAQNYRRRNYKDSGPASNVARTIINANADRLGLPIGFHGDVTDLGTDIKVRTRMDTLADVLVEKLDKAGIGLHVGGMGIVPGELEFRFYVPVVRPDVLTVESGALVDWTWSQSEPTFTRGVLGAAGEGTRREYAAFANPTREGVIGTIKEQFVECREIGSDLEDGLRTLAEADTAVIKANADLDNLVARTTSAYNKLEFYDELRVEALWTKNNGPQYSESMTYADQIIWNKNSNRLTHYESLVADALAAWQGAITIGNTASAAYQQCVDAFDAQLLVNTALREEMADELRERYEEANVAGATKYGISVTLAETETFRYGKSFLVGDIVTVELGPTGVQITDTIREVTLSKTVDEGLLVTPIVGDEESLGHPNGVLIRTMRRLSARTRKLNTIR